MSAEDFHAALLVDAHDLAPCPDCDDTELEHWPDCPRVADGQADYDELAADIARDEL